MKQIRIISEFRFIGISCHYAIFIKIWFFVWHQFFELIKMPLVFSLTNIPLSKANFIISKDWCQSIYLNLKGKNSPLATLIGNNPHIFHILTFIPKTLNLAFYRANVLRRTTTRTFFLVPVILKKLFWALFLLNFAQNCFHDCRTKFVNKISEKKIVI